MTCSLECGSVPRCAGRACGHVSGGIIQPRLANRPTCPGTAWALCYYLIDVLLSVSCCYCLGDVLLPVSCCSCLGAVLLPVSCCYCLDTVLLPVSCCYCLGDVLLPVSCCYCLGDVLLLVSCCYCLGTVLLPVACCHCLGTVLLPVSCCYCLGTVPHAVIHVSSQATHLQPPHLVCPAPSNPCVPCTPHLCSLHPSPVCPGLCRRW